METLKKEIIVDCRAHLLGRVAATVAKQLLNGQRVTLVRCEEINISGSLYRNKLKYDAFLRKRSNSNPRKHSHIHFRAPSKIMWRTIRGMLPHKQPRGVAALEKLKVYEGIPPSCEKKKRVVIPKAMKTLRLKSHRAFCRLGDISSRVGWKLDPLMKRLEDRRRVRSEAYYQKRIAAAEEFKKAKAAALKELSKAEREILTKAGAV